MEKLLAGGGGGGVVVVWGVCGWEEGGTVGDVGGKDAAGHQWRIYKNPSFGDMATATVKMHNILILTGWGGGEGEQANKRDAVSKINSTH